MFFDTKTVPTRKELLVDLLTTAVLTFFFFPVESVVAWARSR